MGRDKSPSFDISKPAVTSTDDLAVSVDDEEHVLVLDFADAPKGKKSANEGYVMM